MAFDFHKYNERYVQNAKEGGEPINDAKDYGVRLVPAEVAEGKTYWKVIGVHHLRPEENIGNHNVFLEALNEDGQRVTNPIAWAGWTWAGKRPEERADPVALDKPDYEPAGNIAMHFSQTVSTWMLGLSREANDITDTVENLHTRHPDEAPGNTLGHHSFYVVFQQTRKAITEPSPTQSIISGRVVNGAGRTLLLIKAGNVVDSQLIPESTEYGFENLAAGVYALQVSETNVRQDNIVLDGTNSQQVNLVVLDEGGTPEKTIDHYILFGPPDTIGRQTNLLLSTNYILHFSVTSGYSVAEAMQARLVTIIGEGISPEELKAIRDSGSTVEVLAGDAYAIEAELNERIRTGDEFPRQDPA